ncbi:MAG: ATP-binding protein [Eubacterium sp.]|nr:ATP-binding protein [Eubacterium sp.]
MHLNNSQYEHLMNQYYERQYRNKEEEARRLQEIHEKLPAYRDLDDQISQLSLDFAKAKLRRDQDSGDLSVKIQEISQKKAKLLLEAGYPEDYLHPIYDCPDCKDTGYIGDQKCHCFERAIVDFLYSQSNLKNILDEENFQHFNMDFYPDDFVDEATGMTPKDNMHKILEQVKAFIDTFDENPDNLLIYGTTGLGKTFLTNCIAKELLDKSHSVVYLTSLKLFDILEKYKFDRDLLQSEKSAGLAYLYESDLLIIDDLGTELNNGFTSSQLYHCIDTRIKNHRATIISTNLSFDDIRESYSERIFSRLTCNYTLLKLTGDDIRLKKAIMKLQNN